MTVSWVMLTFNRGDIVRRAFEHNAANAGTAWDEIVWVDNGSDPAQWGLMEMALPYDTAVRHKTNLGVAKGYNRAMGLATKDYIVITGCDMLMPPGWLATFKDYVEKIPETGVCSLYSKPLTECPERIRGPAQVINDMPLVPAIPIERRIFKRELLADFGYFPEKFGLYGFDDIAWSNRVERVCLEKQLRCYVIPDRYAEHLGTEGVVYQPDGKDDPAYHAMKRKEFQDPAKKEELARLRELGWPKFSPFF